MSIKNTLSKSSKNCNKYFQILLFPHFDFKQVNYLFVYKTTAAVGFHDLNIYMNKLCCPCIVSYRGCYLLIYSDKILQKVSHIHD